MAMNLAEAAHAQALRDAKPPPEQPRPIPGTKSTYTPPSTRTAYDSTLASNFFQEFSRCARQAILLEARLDSGAYDNAPAIPGYAEHAAHQRETSPDAPPRPRQPSDETRIHHERLEDECLAFSIDDPDKALRTITENLETAIAESSAANLSLLSRRADASPPPRAKNIPADRELAKPASPATPPAKQTHAQSRASPIRS